MKTRKIRSLALALALCLALLPAAAAADPDPTDCLKGTVYYGNLSRCRMTSAQALDYADAIESAVGALESKNKSRMKRSGQVPGAIHSYAALFDLGSGTPAVLFAAGLVEEYDWTDWSENIRADGCDWANLGSQRVWYYREDSDKAGEFGADVHIALHRGYVFYGGLAPDAATHYDGKVYPLNGGKFADETLTRGEYTDNHEQDKPVAYRVDGHTVTEAEFRAWQDTWEKTPVLAGHRWTGGVGGTITGLGDARSLAAALRAYAEANGMPARAQTLIFMLDGRLEGLRAYAIKDANGAETNYVRLREVAVALQSTDAKFSVDWDGRVIIRAGEDYVPNGTEWETPFVGDRDYTPSADQTVVNGAATALDAILLTDDAGNGYTYYRLRDLAQALDFNVGWSADRGVFVETDKPYDPAN